MLDANSSHKLIHSSAEPEQLTSMHQVGYPINAAKLRLICGDAAVPLRQRLQLAGSAAAASSSGPGFLPAVAQGLTGFVREPVRSDCAW